MLHPKFQDVVADLLRQKHMLRVRLRLVQLLVLEQLKLLLRGQVVSKRFAGPLELVWDPLTETIEAPPCSSCGRPGYTFMFTRRGQLVCPSCEMLGQRGGKKPR